MSGGQSNGDLVVVVAFSVAEGQDHAGAVVCGNIAAVVVVVLLGQAHDDLVVVVASSVAGGHPHDEAVVLGSNSAVVVVVVDDGTAGTDGHW